MRAWRVRLNIIPVTSKIMKNYANTSSKKNREHKLWSSLDIAHNLLVKLVHCLYFHLRWKSRQMYADVRRCQISGKFYLAHAGINSLLTNNSMFQGFLMKDRSCKQHLTSKQTLCLYTQKTCTLRHPGKLYIGNIKFRYCNCDAGMHACTCARAWEVVKR